MIDSELLRGLTESYLKSLIAEASGSLSPDFDSFAPFGELGIDSFRVLKIIRILEADFGTLPKSLLFENFNIHDLANYFVDKHEQVLLAKFDQTLNRSNSFAHTNGGPAAPAEVLEEKRGEAASRLPAVTPEADPIRILEREAFAHPELRELVQSLFDRYKIEGSVSRGTRKIAPNLFIGGARRGYFNYGRCKDLIVVYSYTGPRDYVPTLLQEMYRYCESAQLQFNFLAAEEILSVGGVSFSATPFGVLQRILKLKEFTLEGGAMRRLRYQVSKFEKAGTCRTEEYRCGSNPEIDKSIARIIDLWCGARTMVNPLIHDVKAEILAGTLRSEHRLFLTYLDGTLQNVILITAMSPEENGYLMDLEFYPPDMPLGGLEFAIVQVIAALVTEGCDVLSLGGTYGCKLVSSANADPAIDRVLDDLRAQNIFNDAGNLQFKNKFRPENKTIYLSRPVGSRNPDSVIDIIMMIADPERMQSSDEENHNFRKAPHEAAGAAGQSGAPLRAGHAPAQVIGQVAIEEEERFRILSEFGFNPLNIPHDYVEFDLKTDSWAQLEMPAIEAQIRYLQALLPQAASVEESLKAVFPFPHFVLAGSGQQAEHVFFKAWPKKGVVLQNLLFPSTIFHQIDKGFTPHELPHPAVFDLNSREPYKGNMDWKALQAEVARDPNAIALVCIELGNNAAGGHPVSLQHLRDVKALLSKYSIPLVLDGTRALENAQFLIGLEKECADQSIWAVVREIFTCADAVIGSLTKDFCVTKGGMIAVHDAKLFQGLQEVIQEEGGGIDLIDKKRIALSLQNRKQIEAKVLRRMEGVRRIWRALNERNIPVVHPAGGHCVLIDAKQLPEFREFAFPVACFTAWLYLNTGIRAAGHSVGMQRHTSLNDLVRLAVPVGPKADQIDRIIERLLHAFGNKVNIPEVIALGGALQLPDANYKLAKYHRVSQSAPARMDAAASGQHVAGMNGSVPTSSVASLSSRQASGPGEAVTAGNASQESPSAQLALPANPCRSQDIAIVGMAGRYPKAKDMAELWENLAQGKDCIEDIPANRYERRLHHGSAAKYRGGFIGEVDQFDSLFFNISPMEAEMLDPQERLFLEVAWEAIEDAGYYPEILAQEDGSRNIGVFVGAVWAMYQMLGVEEKHFGNQIVPNSFLWSIANRVSYWMNFSGPSLTVDTACSASLTALYLACEALHAGECSAAIVGGVNLDLHQAKLDINQSGGALSADGICRAFGKGANGYVAGEGIGALFLKPLDVAVKNRDNIYGVIKSAVVNHGGRTSGYTVPNPKAQAKLIVSALEKAKVGARSIGYIEAHGTGTELGDPIEIAGLSSAFGGDKAENQSCAVGSIKSNIGHLEAAAGVVSVSKVLLQMKHRALVPSLHSSEPNEFIDFRNSPFYVVQHLEEWKAKEIDGVRFPLRAGVSSFGAGGSNAHIILEHYEPAEEPAGEPVQTNQELIFPLSAKSEDQLREAAIRLAKFLERNPVDLNDAAYTLQVGRKSFDYRLAVLAQCKEALLERLANFIAGKKDSDVVIGHVKGADGITRLLNRKEKEEFLRLLLQRRDPHKLAELWAEGLLADWQGLQGSTVARKISLPTYPFADKRHWAVKKSMARPSSRPAAGIHPMVDSNESTFERQIFKKTFHDRDFFIYDHLVANIPTLPGVAYLELVRKAGEIAAGGRKVQKIRNIIWVSPIVVQNSIPKEVFVELKPTETLVRFEVFSNDDKNNKVLHSQGTLLYATKQEAAAPPEHVDLEGIRARCAKIIDGERAYPLFKSYGLNLGPSFQVLQDVYKNENETFGALKLPEFREAELQTMVLHPSLVDGSLQAGVSAQLGDKADEMLVPFSIGEVEILQPLPANCFSYVTGSKEDRKAKPENARLVKNNVLILDEAGRVLVKISDSTGVPLREVNKAAPETDAKGFAKLYYSYDWQEAPLAAENSPKTPGSIVLFAADEMVRLYQERLKKTDTSADQVIWVQPGESFRALSQQSYRVNPQNKDDFERFFASLMEKQLPIENICFAWPLGCGDWRDEKRLQEALEKGVYSFLFLCQALIKHRLENRAQLLYVYSTKPGETQPHHEAISGFIKVLRLEHPKLFCKAIEIRQEHSDYEQVLDRIAEELQAHTQDATGICYDSQGRRARKLKAFDFADSAVSPDTGVSLRNQGVYLITGGAGGLGLIFAEYLAKECKARLVLTGRSKLSSQQEAKLEEIKKAGADVMYLPADVADRESVRKLMAESASRFGAINGIIHSAGVLGDSNIRNKTIEEINAVFAPKIFGTLHLDEATQKENLDFFVVFSSLAAVAGSVGQSDYSFANHFMDSFAADRELLRAKGERSGKTLSFNWSIWADGGMKLNEQATIFFKKTLGIRPLSIATGLEAFTKGLASERSQLAVLEGIQEKVELAWGLRKKDKPADAPAIAASTQTGTVAVDNPAAGNGGSNTNCPRNAAALSGEQAGSIRIQRLIVEKVSEALQMQGEDIDNDAPFADYGVNSVLGVNFLRVISETLGVEIDPIKLFEYTTVNELTQYICSTWPDLAGQAPESQNRGRSEPYSNSQPPGSSQLGDEQRFTRKSLPAREVQGTAGTLPERSLRDTVFEPIAIIGMSGRFAESESLEEFWEHLKAGKNLIKKVSRWTPEECVTSESSGNGYCSSGSFVDSIDRFDPAFFGISPLEAIWTDPQQRLFLEEAWRALEDAGYAGKVANEKLCGVYVGCSSSNYERLFVEDQPPQVFWGNAVSVIPARIAYYLNLHGPAIAVDTASSSSLVAIHLACQGLWSGEMEMALAGGVFLQPTPGFYRVTNGAGLLSPDGKCYTFDARANGFVPGEGVGVLVLKRLQEALQDGDYVHGVIAGTGINQDGASNGLIAPNARAQERLERWVYDRFKINPETIQVVEANGTGTLLGDSIEYQAISRAFRQYTDKKQYCAIGSVASNMGHAATVAGVAGALKLLLALKHRQIPPSLHFETSNPSIQFESGPFYVATELKEWVAQGDQTRRAAVSSFGIGGTNAHLVLEEAPPREHRNIDLPGYVVVLSARSSGQLKQQARNLLASLKRAVDFPMNDLSFTLFVGRMHVTHRLACVAQNQKDLIHLLEQWIETGTASQIYTSQAQTGKVREQASLKKFGNHCIQECTNGITAAAYLENLTTIAELFVKGYSLDFHALFPRESRRIPLPTYPFADERYWVNGVRPEESAPAEQQEQPGCIPTKQDANGTMAACS